jgi:hypothetical protein
MGGVAGAEGHRGTAGDLATMAPNLPAAAQPEPHQPEAVAGPAPNCLLASGGWGSGWRGGRGLTGQRTAAGRLRRGRSGSGPRRARALLPLGRRRQRYRAVPACPHRQGVGGRDPRLACHRRLLQRAHRGGQPAGQEGQAGRAGFRNFANYRLRLRLRYQMADAPDGKAVEPLRSCRDLEPELQAAVARIVNWVARQ